jgi:hypothetical protein
MRSGRATLHRRGAAARALDGDRLALNHALGDVSRMELCLEGLAGVAATLST